MTSRIMLFGIEAIVLNAFVAVQSFVLWTFSGISNRAMYYVPGFRRLHGRFTPPPHSATGKGPALPRPAAVNVAPVRTDVPGGHTAVNLAKRCSSTMIA